ncbi:hypothetical protein BGX21_003615 [Mortierella sp. AD011]|nr:hypothetical protein BGX21_003615 [Mortierella sp. AD011]
MAMSSHNIPELIDQMRDALMTVPMVNALLRSDRSSFDFLLKKIDTLQRNQDLIISNAQEAMISNELSTKYSLKFPTEIISLSTKVTVSSFRKSSFTKERRLKNTTCGQIGVYSLHAIYRKRNWGLKQVAVSADIDIFLSKFEHDNVLIKVFPDRQACERKNHADIWEYILENRLLTLTDNILEVNSAPTLSHTMINSFDVLPHFDNDNVSHLINPNTLRLQ